MWSCSFQFHQKTEMSSFSHRAFINITIFGGCHPNFSETPGKLTSYVIAPTTWHAHCTLSWVVTQIQGPNACALSGFFRNKLCWSWSIYDFCAEYDSCLHEFMITLQSNYALHNQTLLLFILFSSCVIKSCIVLLQGNIMQWTALQLKLVIRSLLHWPTI